MIGRHRLSGLAPTTTAPAIRGPAAGTGRACAPERGGPVTSGVRRLGRGTTFGCPGSTPPLPGPRWPGPRHDAERLMAAAGCLDRGAVRRPRARAVAGPRSRPNTVQSILHACYSWWWAKGRVGQVERRPAPIGPRRARRSDQDVPTRARGHGPGRDRQAAPKGAAPVGEARGLSITCWQ
jgi:hypothetical protein